MENKIITDVQNDYFNTGLTINEIAEKHNVSKEKVSAYKGKYLKPEIKIIERVMLFDEIDILRIEALLKESKIWYQMPFDCKIIIKSKL